MQNMDEASPYKVMLFSYSALPIMASVLQTNMLKEKMWLLFLITLYEIGGGGGGITI